MSQEGTKVEHSELLRKIVSQIELSFPMVYVEIETVAESDEVFLLVDSMEIYEGVAYQEMVARTKSELLWPNGVFNVFFGVSETYRQFVAFRIHAQGTHSYTEFSFGTDVCGREQRLPVEVRGDLAMAA